MMKEGIDLAAAEQAKARTRKRYADSPETEMDVAGGAVDSPPHYKSNVSGIETIDCVEAMLTPTEFIGTCKGSVLKYISRAGKKVGNPELQDLRKARWYLNKLIATMEKEL